MEYQGIFKRHEKKYILTPDQYDALLLNLPPLMTEDTYGIYHISNLYYDTDHYDLIRHSIQKPVFKEKFRVRSYGPAPDGSHPLYLELKKKYKGVVYKRRAALPYQEAMHYLAAPGTAASSQILREISWFLHYYEPRPKAFLSYDRRALRGRDDPGLRLTFDYNIRCRSDHLHDFTDFSGQAILPEGTVLMEVKTTAAIPLSLTRLFTELAIYPSSFSKYGEYYKQYLINDNTGGIPYAG